VIRLWGADLLRSASAAGACPRPGAIGWSSPALGPSGWMRQAGTVEPLRAPGALRSDTHGESDRKGALARPARRTHPSAPSTPPAAGKRPPLPTVVGCRAQALCLSQAQAVGNVTKPTAAQVA
jgi:hypothetical protein